MEQQQTPPASLTIIDSNLLRSIRNEASRQAEFFERRNQDEVAEGWLKIEAIAHQCITQRVGLRLIVCEFSERPTILKHCE